LNINDQITAEEVRLISQDGEQLGIVPLEEALEKAADSGVDLVEVAPLAKPPVCKIIDYGKMLYEAAKKEKEAKKKQHTISVKEVRMRPKTDDHDLEFKVKHARKFLEQKNRVKFSVFFRGREMDHTDLGEVLLKRVLVMLEDIAKVESSIRQEGRNMTMVLSHK
jgi:translation initiation factor IF-3